MRRIDLLLVTFAVPGRRLHETTFAHLDRSQFPCCRAKAEHSKTAMPTDAKSPSAACVLIGNGERCGTNGESYRLGGFVCILNGDPRCLFRRVPFLLLEMGSTLLALVHPLGANPCARRDGAALLFRFLPEQISRAREERAATAHKAGEISSGSFPKSAAGPWEQGTLTPLRVGASREQSGPNQLRRKHLWHSTKTLSA